MNLGSVELSDHLVLNGLETASGIVANQRRTIGGVSVVQVGQVIGGRELMLSGENHFTLEQIQAVKVLEAAGQPVEMVHHRGAFTVLITGTQVSPAQEHADECGDDWYSGDITMIEM